MIKWLETRLRSTCTIEFKIKYWMIELVGEIMDLKIKIKWEPLSSRLEAIVSVNLCKNPKSTLHFIVYVHNNGLSQCGKCNFSANTENGGHVFTMNAKHKRKNKCQCSVNGQNTKIIYTSSHTQMVCMRVHYAICGRAIVQLAYSQKYIGTFQLSWTVVHQLFVVCPLVADTCG